MRWFALLLLVLLPGVALAHHPGLLGPVTHLGWVTISKVVGVAALDAVNPTALGMLLLIMKGSLERGTKRLSTGFLYVAGIITIYAISGLVLRSAYLTYGPAIPILLFQAVLAFALFTSGLSETVGVLNPSGQSILHVPPAMLSLADRLMEYLEKGFAFPLGIMMGAIELFATGAIYLSFIQAVTYDPTARLLEVLALIVIYLFVFSLPLVALLFSREFVELSIGKKRLTKAGRLTRAVIGLLFMAAAVWIAASAYVTLQATVL